MENFLVAMTCAVIGFISGITAQVFAARYHEETKPSFNQSLKNFYTNTTLVNLFLTGLFGMIFVLGYSRIQALHMDLIPALLLSVVLLILFPVLLVLTLIDLKVKLLPTKIIYPALLVVSIGLVGAALLNGEPVRILTMAIGLVANFLVYYLIWFFKPGVMGYGDVRLSLILGSVAGWFGIGPAIATIALSFMLPTFYFLFMIAIRRIPTDSKIKIAFGPWMILGMTVSVLFSDIVVGFYTQTGGPLWLI